MVEAGLANAGLFCLPKSLSKEKEGHIASNSPPEKKQKSDKGRPVYCKSCEYFSEGDCLLGFERCSFEGVQVSKQGRTVHKMKCPDDCTYSVDGFCMGVCMRNLLADHRKRWKSGRNDGRRK